MWPHKLIKMLPEQSCIPQSLEICMGAKHKRGAAAIVGAMMVDKSKDCPQRWCEKTMQQFWRGE